MRFSELFNIDRTPEDDWFDPHLTIDTKLFIDPMLMLHAGKSWSDAHSELIEYFGHCYKLIAKAGSEDAPTARAALRLLQFPEPEEFHLGYTSHGTKGSGAGKGYAQTIMDGIKIAVAAGLNKPEHIEEIGILHDGIGADRISDMVCNVLKSRFIQYTQEIAKRHNIPLTEFKIKQMDLEYGRMRQAVLQLPATPNNTPLLLVPQRILSTLPTLNAEDWFYSDFNRDLRDSLNLQVGRRVPKSTIVELAQQHPDRIRQWAKEQASRPDLKGYNFSTDPEGYIAWDKEGHAFANANPLPPRRIDSTEDLIRLMNDIVNQFKHFIEHRGGWKLLWDTDRNPRKEEFAQLLFQAIAQTHLRYFNIELDREVELGRGPVDFKASCGTHIRLLIEVKKLENSKFWQGLENQLPSYLTSDECNTGWFLVLQYKDNKSNSKIEEINSRIHQISEKTGNKIYHSFVDARPKESASKII